MNRSSSESDCTEAGDGNFLDLDGYLDNGSTRQHTKGHLVVDAGSAGLEEAPCASTGSTSTCSASRQTKQISHDSGPSFTNERRQNEVTSSTVEKMTRRPTSSRASHAPSKPYTHTGRHSKARSILTERSSKLIKHKRNTTERPSTITDLSTGYSSSKYQSDISMDKIIMSTLEELYRLLAERRHALPTTLPAARKQSSESRTISEITRTYTSHTRQSKLRKGSQFGRSLTGAPGRGRECIVAYALSNNMPRKPKVSTESELREGSSVDSQDVMPGGFNLDDPVRLYQQAKQLEATCGDRLPSSSSPQSSSKPPQSRKSTEDAPAPSLCALCRHYWRVARRYLSSYTAELGGV